ncbi:glycoside hydrolase [Niabella ginsenosidivorans]|uniref:Glycoside hydrolase n=1 Tax=Niabella ginsenosidivorans TaxID=1176587 RepID=A0A1A9HXZ7_9BACT|nr:malectin domain-containing carbohydrate-binding protein [Niabella ginsenosidivorans]ANH80256.1 glycoside hydrolase [Niabella ginsenosidivorans]
MRTGIDRRWIYLMLVTCFSFLTGTQLAAQWYFERDTLSLNEGWLTVATDSLLQEYKGFEQAGYNTAGWKKVTAPHNWDDYYGYRRLLHGNFHGNAWYKKKFSISKQQGKRYLLFFEGVGSYATVWVNGIKVGAHAGGRTTFTLDITDAVKKEGVNDLAVLAEHPAGIKDLAWVCGGCSDERGFSEGSQPLGIFRPVRLIVTGNIRIAPFGVHAWSAIKKNRSELFVNATIKNDRESAAVVQLIARLKNKKQQVVAESRQTVRLQQLDSVTVALPKLTIDHPELWSPEHPYLYTIETIIKTGAVEVDKVRTDFGFRTLHWNTATHRFFLNDTPVFINGIAEYEHQLGQSHAFSNEEIIARVKWLQAAGFNAFRDAHQPHNLLYGTLFDQKGILWWPQLSAHIWYDTPEFRKQFKASLREWVLERRNDPAVILWGLQNESKLPEDFAKECTALIRSLDPTASVQRLVTTCNGGKGTDWDVPQNWTGTYGGNPDTYDRDLKKQVLIGEYGAWRTLGLHEADSVRSFLYTEDNMVALMEKKLRLGEAAKDSSAGHFLWLLNSHDNPGRVQGGEGFRAIDRIGPVNYKGMLTSWEEPTDVYYMYRSNYASKQTDPMVYIASHTWPNRWMTPGIKDAVVVYSNCDEVELFNDMEAASLGRKKNNGRGYHFQWDHVNIRYNILYAVGYVNGKVVARDTILLYHLPQAPHFEKLYADARNSTAPRKGYTYVYRVNCGGPDYRDQNGNTWQADRPLPHFEPSQTSKLRSGIPYWGSSSWADRFTGMPSFFASQQRTFSPVKGTRDWPLFQDFRYGKNELKYTFPLPDGNYIAELYFAEPWLGVGGGSDASGMRLLNVAFNDTMVLNDLDIWKEAGTNTALKKTIPVTVKGGRLVISFPGSKAGQALIAAIAIATKDTRVKAANAFENVTVLNAQGVELQSWLDIGNRPFEGETIRISRLPPELFTADWLRVSRKKTKDISFRVQQASDIYLAIPPDAPALYYTKEYEPTNLFIITDEAGGRKYVVFKKRVPAGAVYSLKQAGSCLVMITPSSNMQPAFDLKPVTGYKADGAIAGTGITMETISGAPRLVVQTNAATSIEWPVSAGVADIYNITLKYFYPLQEDRTLVLTVTDAGGNRMVEQNIPLKFTPTGKWSLSTVNTRTMINAGHYTVRLTVKNLKGLVVSGIEVQ